MKKIYLGAAALVSLVVLATSSSVAMAKGTEDKPAVVIIDQSGSNNNVDANITNDSSNPIPVTGAVEVSGTVTVSTPTPRIPVSLLGGCFFSVDDSLCDARISQDVVFPEGTNTLEIHTIQARFVKVSESADYDVKFSMNVRFRTPGDFYNYGVSGVYGPAFNRGNDEYFYHSENVLMFAEFVPSGRCELSEAAARNNQSCRVLLTGYYIWVDE